MVDNTLIQAKDVLIQHADHKQVKESTSSNFNSGEENAHNKGGLEQKETSVDMVDSFQDDIVQLHIQDTVQLHVQDKEEADTIAKSQDTSSAMKTVDGGLDDISEDGCRLFKEGHTFREEGEEVKSAMEKYKLEQVQVEEQLSKELNQREVM